MIWLEGVRFWNTKEAEAGVARAAARGHQIEGREHPVFENDQDQTLYFEWSRRLASLLAGRS